MHLASVTTMFVSGILPALETENSYGTSWPAVVIVVVLEDLMTAILGMATKESLLATVTNAVLPLAMVAGLPVMSGVSQL